MSLRVTEHNVIQYRFYEKPTASSVCFQADTALGQNGLVQSLVEEVKRRMLNTSTVMPTAVRCKILDKFAQKMINSGHSVQQARKNILSGVKGYETKLKQCAKNCTPVNRSAAGSGASRRKKKLTGKTDWFRKPSKPNSQTNNDVHYCKGETWR